MKLEDLQVYQLGMEVGEFVWEIVNKWDYFNKDTIGKQLVRSADSIAANLSEGYGRFSYKENRQFCYFSRGSLSETITWLVKARNRNLIEEKEYKIIEEKLQITGKMLNNYIKSIGK
jgi:four helix bundle protein